uniref:HIT-type domain-containing protein n=1 Tax=Parastrongyloides trichosuri TaxID=131310 RepID=A0A0N4ZV69_PARTI
MNTCFFCNCDSTSLNKCPRCKKYFCSLKCYKFPNHYCSEHFYKEWIDKETGKELKKGNPLIMPFEEYMKHHENIEEVDMPPDISEAEAEANDIDSDDDNLDYLEDVVNDATEDFNKLSMRDIDAMLTTKGLTMIDDDENNMNNLFSQLTSEEQKTFNRLFEEYQISLSGASKSCFENKK